MTVRLPRAERDAAAEKQSDISDARSRTSEKLLLVDDDADVRAIVSQVLTELGYSVREADGAQAALAALSGFTPDLLIVDFAMPNMNGADLVTTVRVRNSRLKILFVSGYTDSALLETAVGNAVLLRKPFRPSELAAAVRTALDN